MSTYQEKKKKAREKAIEWQERFGEQSISYEELAIAQSVFEQLGRRYGLLTEFRENGFIVYIIAMTGNLYTRGTTEKYIAGFCLLASITVLIMEVMMADRISKAFGKNALWTLGLLIIFPVFAIILGCKGDLTTKAKEKIENQLKKKAEKN